LKIVHAPYRVPAKPEPDGPDEADAYEALLRARAARGRRVLVTIWGALAVLSIMALLETPPKPRTPELAAVRARARVADARDTIAAARAFVQREQARFAATMNAVLDADLAPDDRHRPCGVELPETTLLRAERPFPLLVVAKGDRDLPSPSVASMLADVNRADEHLAAGRTMDAILHANALAARMGSAWGQHRYDVVLVTTTMKRPVRTTATSYEPGELSGRAYLYDFAEHRVTCVGDIHAVSSRRIEYSYVSALTGPAAMDEGPRLSASLDEDLERQIRRAISRGALVAIDGRH